MTNSKQRRRKRFKRDHTLKLRLTERDKNIIRWVYRHRVLSSEHIIQLVNGSQQGILRRLHLLFHAGYLDRPRRQTFSLGSNQPLIYGLGNKGAALLASEFDLPVENIDWGRKNREAKEIFLAHALLVSHVLMTFRLLCRRQRNLEFIETEHLINCRQKPPTIKSHALSWQVDVSKGEYNQKKRLSFNMVPDSVFGIRIKKGFNRSKEIYFFLEVDRSTMPVKRTNMYRSSIYKKMIGYITSYKNNLFSDYFGFKKVRVLTVTKSRERIGNMIKANKELHELGQGYNLFMFAIDESINIETPEKILKYIWKNGQGYSSTLFS